MEIVSRGPTQILNQNLSFDYEPRSVVQRRAGADWTGFPGLHVGQKWESRMVNPFTGQVEAFGSRWRGEGSFIGKATR